jgi:hypothetical protein|tara:strand:+ start:185 stop:604 length:420 start_codon:yes stop_codon:yes gene_type:complete
MKANTKDMNYVALLRHYIDSEETSLNSNESMQLRQAYSILLDTNIVFMDYSQMVSLCEKLEAKEITNSQAERVATKWVGFKPSVVLEQRMARNDNDPDAIMQLFFGRDCKWTEGFAWENGWGHPKNLMGKDFVKDNINL